MVRALSRVPSPSSPPGREFRYSNAGYVCLALAVQRAAGQPLPDLARELLFDPAGMRDTVFWPGPGPRPPGSVPLDPPHPAPLSLGDGGVWSTAHDLLRWSRAMNDDALGVAALLQTPGTLDDGQPLDYAWGVGVRTHAGRRTYRHGGAWPGLRVLLARIPDLGVCLAVVAPADNTDRRIPLADALLDELTRTRPRLDG